MKRTIVTLLACAYCTISTASERLLRDFFNDVSTLQANFTQRVTDETGMTLESSSGVFYLSRPGRFRWSYHSLDSDVPLGQQIISDGKLITFYEPELETATQRSFAEAVDQVPTMVLVQSGGDLDKHFSISDFGLTDGQNWVALKPKESDAGYQELMIGFSGKRLKTIILTDGLGNETRLTLSGVKSNLKLKKKVFKFDAPDGVDVVN